MRNCKTKYALIILMATTGLLLLSTCKPTRRISDNRIIQNEKAINEIASYLINNKIYNSYTRDIADKTIKKRLKKIKIKEVEVMFNNPYFCGETARMDTIIKYSRWGIVFFSYYEEILLVKSNVDDTLESKLNKWTFNKVTKNIYYSNHIFAPM